MQRAIRAAFIRGGTSKGLFFHHKDLPADRNDVLIKALGSPDRYGRQLDGMGGGISSLSKVMIVSPPLVQGADVSYTFAQIAVKEAKVDWRSNCGNLTSAIGPFAVDEGLVRPKPAPGESSAKDEFFTQLVLHNTNTDSLVRARFRVKATESGFGAVVQGDTEIAGVDGSASPVYLGFMQPGGAVTKKGLLPTKLPAQPLHVPGFGTVTASCVDATLAMVFVRGDDIGLDGTELPAEIEGRPDILDLLDRIRTAGGEAMGLVESHNVPKIAIVAPPKPYKTLSGERVEASESDVLVRALSMGRPHRAVPLTAGLCTAAAATLRGTVVANACGPLERSEAQAADTAPTEERKVAVRLGTPSGVVPITTYIGPGLEGISCVEIGADRWR